MFCLSKYNITGPAEDEPFFVMKTEDENDPPLYLMFTTTETGILVSVHNKTFTVDPNHDVLETGQCIFTLAAHANKHLHKKQGSFESIRRWTVETFFCASDFRGKGISKCVFCTFLDILPPKTKEVTLDVGLDFEMRYFTALKNMFVHLFNGYRLVEEDDGFLVFSKKNIKFW